MGTVTTCVKQGVTKIPTIQGEINAQIYILYTSVEFTLYIYYILRKTILLSGVGISASDSKHIRLYYSSYAALLSIAVFVFYSYYW